MSGPSASLLRVRNWDGVYENNRSREINRTHWVPVPNDLSACAYVDLVSHDQGAAHLGAWIAILMVASKAKPRCGLLVREDGRPHTAESLARVTRLPQDVMQEAIDRLLEIELLEVIDPDSPEISHLGSHPGAGKPQGHARKPQEGAAEGKGTEHHHQEGNGKEKKGTERAEAEFAPQHSGARSTQPDFPKNGDDGEKPGKNYASDEEELKAIYYAKAGSLITFVVLDAIRENLALNRVSMREFVAEVRKHSANDWRNPAGFLRDLSKRFRAKTAQAPEPVTAEEAAARDYRCPQCFSKTPGRGLLAVEGGKFMPCSCANDEYIAEQRARGVLPAESSNESIPES